MNDVLSTATLNENASAEEGKKRRHPGALQNTSPVLWAAGCVLTLTFLLLRTPFLFSIATERVQQLTELQEFNNLALAEMAAAFAFYLGIVLNAAGLILYFYLASVIETRFFPTLKFSCPKISLGFLGSCSLCCVLPVQLYALAFGVVSPKDSWYHYFFLISVATLTLAYYRRKWQALSYSRRITAFISCYGCCLISVFL